MDHHSKWRHAGTCFRTIGWMLARQPKSWHLHQALQRRLQSSQKILVEQTPGRMLLQQQTQLR